MNSITIAMTLVLTGCVSVQTSDRGKSRVYIGIVRVATPDRVGRVSAIDIKTLGLGWNNGPFLGWNADNWVIADPAECQLLVVIRTGVQAEGAARVLESLRGQQPCIVDYTHSLPR